MSECSHDCGNCGSNCGERSGKNPFLQEMNSKSNIKHVIGVVSGKGGVGKSLVTSLLASKVSRDGFKTAILDADITGPSIPKAFGVKERATAEDEMLIPVTTKDGIKIMSLNLLSENESDPVVWRGPIIAGTVKQFWSDVFWGDVDYMFVDMPPGTGDVPLTVFQSLPLDGIVIVTSPQDLVSMIVLKAVRMAEMMNIPIIGLVENYSYLECPDCGKKISVFGESKVKETANEFNIETFDTIPINPLIADYCDTGDIYNLDLDLVGNIVNKIESFA